MNWIQRIQLWCFCPFLASAEVYLLNEDIKWKDKEINLMVLLSFDVLCTSGPLTRGHWLDDREATTAILFHVNWAGDRDAYPFVVRLPLYLPLKGNILSYSRPPLPWLAPEYVSGKKGKPVAAGLSNRPVARSHFCGGNGPPSATRCLRGGGAVVDSKNIIYMLHALEP